jgi:hypothetical protein
LLREEHMPTDVLAARRRKDGADKRETRETTLVLVLVSLGGAFCTIFRAVQSDAFEFALIAMSAVE